MNKVYIIGVGLSVKDLTPAHLEIIQAAQVLMGGRRLLDQFVDFHMEKRVISGNVIEAIDFIGRHRAKQRIVVLASGDPLFYGIGARIIQALGSDQVVVLPNITSIAAAFARIGEPWSHTRVISLHGRNRKYDLLHALKFHEPVAVLTDENQSPRWLARWLLTKGIDNVRMAIFEQLGSPNEAFDWYLLEVAADREFGQPNVVILKTTADGTGSEELFLGMVEAAFDHEGGLITKAEVRAVTLAKLGLGPGLTLWDLGAGSGSVGIEASLLLGIGRVVAVEQNKERVNQIRRNARRFGVFNHEVVTAQLPQGLDRLPTPDRIFIGGGGRNLMAIARSAAGYLGPGGIMVMNTVLVENLSRALDLLNELGMTSEVVQLQVSRGKAMPWSRRLEAENPVWIVSGRRSEAGDG